MDLIKLLSTRVEQEQTRKLQQLGGRGGGSQWHSAAGNGTGGDDNDFESLVTGRSSAAKTNGANDSWEGGWGDDALAQTKSRAPIQTRVAAPVTNSAQRQNLTSPRLQSSRTITPDQGSNAFDALAPSRPAQQTPSYSQPLQPQPSSTQSRPSASVSSAPNYSSWNSGGDSGNPWASSTQPSLGGGMQLSASSNANPWAASGSSSAWGQAGNGMSNAFGNLKLDPPGQNRSTGAGGFGQTQSKNPMDKYDSLL